MKQNLPVNDIERDYANTVNILSTTDLKGAISYFNDDFLKISGFDPAELINKNHNVIRHPEMPPAAFGDLWDTIKDGRSWMGIVKNRCKNGDFYWVDAYVTPIRHNGKIAEYQSVRQKPTRARVNRAEKVYQQLLKGKSPREIQTSKISTTAKVIMTTIASLLVSGLLVSSILNIEPLAAVVLLATAGIFSSLAAFFSLRPLTKAVDKARSVTDNPIARYIYTGRRDDIGSLLLAMKSLSSETTGVVGRISDDSKKLSSCANSLAKTTAIANQGVQDQYAETDMVATATNEMSASITEISSNAQQTAYAAKEAMNESNKGKEVVESTSSSIEALAHNVKHASSVIENVKNDSKDISSIVDVIRGISEQTNLLALNAAIEAARAGEQGRGFAIVADEVRTLASRTNAATAEIQQMIEKLQSGTNEAVTVMAKSCEDASNTVEQATAATQSLEAITNAIIKINDMSTTIASAVVEQSTVAEEINQGIVRIRDTAETTMNASKNMQEASTAMGNLAHSLKDLSEDFWAKKSKV